MCIFLYGVCMTVLDAQGHWCNYKAIAFKYKEPRWLEVLLKGFRVEGHNIPLLSHA